MTSNKAEKAWEPFWLVGWGKKMFILVMLGLLAVLLYQTLPVLGRLIESPVNKIEISGQYRHANLKLTQQNLSRFLGEGLLGLNIDKVKKIVESQPWLQVRTVKRLWPDTLYIQINERVPVAYWNRDGMLTQNGNIFYPTGKLPDLPLPHLFGQVGESQKMLKKYELFSEDFKPQAIRITESVQDKRGSWKLKTRSGVSIVLGVNPVKAQITRVLKLYQSLSEKQKKMLEYVDARYTNGVAVKWRES